MSHTCHAIGCDRPVPPKMFMCRAHWRALPQSHRDAIWHTYRPGQEIAKNPSGAYVRASEAARLWLFTHETGMAATDLIDAVQKMRERKEQA